VTVAKENVAINQADSIISVGRGDLLKGVEGKADIVIANIIADIIIVLLDDIPNKLKIGGTMIASGIIADRLGDVTEAVIAHGLLVDRVLEEGGWAAMVIRNGGSTV